MVVIEQTEQFRQQHDRCVATIGKFDGVHTGHQLIVQQLLDKAAEHGAPSMVILIEPHPEEFFAATPQDCPARLTEFDEKIALLESLGVDFVYKLTFNSALSQLSAEQYIEDILVHGLGLACLIIGNDFRFGNQRRGDYEMLQRYGEQYGFELLESVVCEHQGLRISSTLVREKLQEGDFDLVELLLNRPWCLVGTAAHWESMAQLVKPQGKLCLIVDTEDNQPVNINLLKPKSVAITWEFMFTRARFETDDMNQQGVLLGEAAKLFDAGVLRHTQTENYGELNASNLLKAHAKLESATMIGKLILSVPQG